MQEEKKTLCPACGAFNHGVQTHCLLCQAELPAGNIPAATPATPVHQFCTACGASLNKGQNFCTACGKKR
jgi:NMD protein affecting ribosome stability and mRNA decay